MPIYVNNEEVSEEVIQQELNMLLHRYSEQLSSDEMEARREDIEKDARENALERLLLVQAARKEIGMIPPARVERRFKQVRKEMGGDDAFYERSGLTKADDGKVLADLESQIQYEDFLDRVCREVNHPGADECQTYYDENPEHFKVPETIRAAHIVQQASPGRDPLGVYSALLNIREEIMNGADFAAMAEQFSECDDHGGDLGYFSRGQMVEAFDRVVFKLEVGEVSDVFTTEFGHHIAKVSEKIPEHVQPFEKVMESIREHLLYEKKNERIGETVDRLREEAEIREE
ncbi:MAG: peptidylprolyl isomerase [Verrucomicrobiota bacterium]